jgi:hypothetical protein
MRRRRILFLWLVLSLLEPTGAQARKLYPVDEAPRDPSFLSFRRQLMQASRKRDHRLVLSIVDPRIRNSFGNGGGVNEFKTLWNLERPGSKLWNELGTILSLGGGFRTFQGKRMFYAPYIFSHWPDDLDAFEYGAIVGRNVRVRSGPRATARVIDTLSYDIVRLSEAAGEWVQVVTPSGRRGYVLGRLVRRSIDYRACFEKKGGRWRMTILVAGD